MSMSVCVFCGSAPGARPSYSAAARDLGGALGRAGMTLVYGGGRLGLMGIVADAVLQAGGRVIGVIPRMLIERELAHPNLTRQHVVTTMHERKTLMAEMSDAFVGLPGGMGTFDELVEIVTWAQLGLHAKPVVLANIDNYFAALVRHARPRGGGRVRHSHQSRALAQCGFRDFSHANPCKRRACR